MRLSRFVKNKPRNDRKEKLILLVKRKKQINIANV